jgi:hypothetical protein
VPEAETATIDSYTIDGVKTTLTAPVSETENTIETLAAAMLQLTDNFQSWLKGERERIGDEAKDAEIAEQAAEIKELQSNLDIVHMHGFEKGGEAAAADYKKCCEAMDIERTRYKAQIDWLCERLGMFHRMAQHWKEMPEENFFNPDLWRERAEYAIAAQPAPSAHPNRECHTSDCPANKNGECMDGMAPFTVCPQCKEQGEGE